jgi:hypothetical protein
MHFLSNGKDIPVPLYEAQRACDVGLVGRYLETHESKFILEGEGEYRPPHPFPCFGVIQSPSYL